jgi:putative ABC transport system substrate-binding protein
MNAGRRSLLRAIVAGAFTAIPLAGIGAPARVRRVGVLCQDDGSWAKEALPPLWKELGALGFVEGRDFVVQICAAEEQKVSVPDCAATLVRAKPELIFTQNTPNTRALQQATTTIPIVTGVGDPVGSGFAASLARPGSNITGVSYGTGQTDEKLVELMRLLIPKWTGAVLLGSAIEEHMLRPFMTRMQSAIRKSGATCRLVFLDSRKAAEREFRSMRARGEQFAHINLGLDFEIAELAVRNQVALVSGAAEWVRSGALFSYSQTHRNQERRAASQIASIFRGANPATIPFELPDATELAVNRTTAAKLGIRIPLEVLILATEVIGT